MRHLSRAAIALGLVLGIAGCSEDEPVAPSTAARIIVVNGTTRTVSAHVDGLTNGMSVTAHTVSAALAVRAGDRTITIDDGTSTGVPVVVHATTTLDDVRVITVTESSGTLSAVVLDNPEAAPTIARVRVVHLAPNAPAIDVWRTHPGQTTPVRVAYPFTYGQQTGFLEGEPGIWEVIAAPARAPAEGEPGPRSSALMTLGLNLAEGNVVTIVVFDDPSAVVRLVLLGAN